MRFGYFENLHKKKSKLLDQKIKEKKVECSISTPPTSLLPSTKNSETEKTAIVNPTKIINSEINPLTKQGKDERIDITEAKNIEKTTDHEGPKSKRIIVYHAIAIIASLVLIVIVIVCVSNFKRKMFRVVYNIFRRNCNTLSGNQEIPLTAIKDIGIKLENGNAAINSTNVSLIESEPPTG